MALAPREDSILSVAELTRQIKDTLNVHFHSIWVRGEISGFKRAESGHFYFALKDADALLDCVMWRTAVARLGFEPRDGMEVEALGAVTVYEKRGRYQLVCEGLRPSGIGALLLALEDLKRRLQAEGLFDASRKIRLPRFARRVGLVTSPVGAAVRDIVNVLRRRWPAIQIVLAPVRVQGPGAAEEIARALRDFNRYRKVDVLIVGRGGGSLEDLWPFNEEVVVRAVAESALPIVSAVGHEVDWTLCDLAADVRAATPSAAAELVVPDRRDVERHVDHLAQRLDAAVRRSVELRRSRVESLVQRYGFRRSRDFLGLVQQRVDDLTERVHRMARDTVARAGLRLRQALARYGLRHWPATLSERRNDVHSLRERLAAASAAQHQRRSRQAQALADRLRALGPQAVLERGYCLARGPDGSLVRTAATLRVGDDVALEFARGSAEARVERVRLETSDGSQDKR